MKDAPRRLIPYKPDWKEGEVEDPRSTEFYISEKALGKLYRNIRLTFENDFSHERELTLTEINEDSVYNALKDRITQILESDPPPERELDKMTAIFRRFFYELRYICSAHTLTERRGVELTEEEIVVGIILAPCSQHRWRQERIYRMREHSAKLVRDTLDEILPSRYLDLRTVKRELKFAWGAWRLCRTKLASAQSPKDKRIFGLNSFCLVLLLAIFDCLDRADKMQGC